MMLRMVKRRCDVCRAAGRLYWWGSEPRRLCRTCVENMDRLQGYDERWWYEPDADAERETVQPRQGGLFA